MISHIPHARRAQCEYCGDTLDIEHSSTYVHVSGWSKNRSGPNKGVHGVAFIEEEYRYACGECMDKRKRNIPIGQRKLF